MKKITSLSLVVLFTTVITGSIKAQDFLPDAIQNIFGLLGPDGSGATFFVTSRVQALLLIGLALLVLASVVYAAFAAFKYIRSQGDPGQVEEAGKAVKSIFLGLAVLLFAIVGIVLIFVFFGAEFIGTETYQVCLSAPDSEGCLACTADSDSPAPPSAVFVARHVLAGGGGVISAIPDAGGAGGLTEDFDTQRFANPPLLLVATNGNTTLCSFCEWGYFNFSEGVVSDIADECEEG